MPKELQAAQEYEMLNKLVASTGDKTLNKQTFMDFLNSTVTQQEQEKPLALSNYNALASQLLGHRTPAVQKQQQLQADLAQRQSRILDTHKPFDDDENDNDLMKNLLPEFSDDAEPPTQVLLTVQTFEHMIEQVCVLLY